MSRQLTLWNPLRRVTITVNPHSRTTVVRFDSIARVSRTHNQIGFGTELVDRFVDGSVIAFAEGSGSDFDTACGS